MPFVATERVNPVVKKALEFMIMNIESEVSLDDLAAHIGCCKYSLIRVFKREMQCTPMRWLWRYRLEKARAFLSENPQLSVLAAAHETGYTSLGHLTSAFKRTYGVTPGVYRGLLREMGSSAQGGGSATSSTFSPAPPPASAIPGSASRASHPHQS